MIKCLICHKELKNNRSISAHVKCHNLTSKAYYDLYLRKNNEGKCYNCGANTSYRGISTGYLRCCSEKCNLLFLVSINNHPGRKNIGRKQSEETILKRISNTDQKKKEQTRQNTMTDRYGELFFFPNPQLRSEKISTAHKNKKHSKEHHIKVIETKRKNDTLCHSDKTKKKISIGVQARYNSNDPPITLSTNRNNNKGYKCGHFNGIYYRSSYELQFIEYCVKNNIKVESAENKEYRCKYEIDGKYKWYYPDFYLQDYNTIIEVKPISMIDEIVISKIDAAAKLYAFSLVTEEELENLDIFFDYL